MKFIKLESCILSYENIIFIKKEGSRKISVTVKSNNGPTEFITEYPTNLRCDRAFDALSLGIDSFSIDYDKIKPDFIQILTQTRDLIIEQSMAMHGLKKEIESLKKIIKRNEIRGK